MTNRTFAQALRPVFAPSTASGDRKAGTPALGPIRLGLLGLTLLAAACGGGDDAAEAPQYLTLNYPAAAAGGSTLLTGVRGVTNSPNVYISGFYASPAPVIDTGLIYEGPTSGGGTWHTLTYPSSSGVTVTGTALYGPDNGDTGGLIVVGNYTTSEAGNVPIGLLYRGPVDGSGDWQTITPPLAVTTIPHSNMGGLVVGNYETEGDPAGKAFIYDIEDDSFSELVKPGALSLTAYGIWHNGGSSYTIAGGYFEEGIASGYLVDWNSDTRTTSHWTSYRFKNQPEPGTLLSHFEGITSDGAGGYNLASDLLVADSGVAVDAALVNVPRMADGSFGEATWTNVSYPGSTLTSANTVFERMIIGIYKVGMSVSNGFVASVP